MIEVRDVTKIYGKQRRFASDNGGSQHKIAGRVVALDNISLTIDKPGFYAIMGPSGSGKSTLLHLLAGLDVPNTGSIIVNDKPIHDLSERALTLYRRRDIGIVFQQFNLLPTMDAITNVMLPGLLDGQPRKPLHDRAKELLTTLGLADRATHRPDALSGGEQQRVAICRALLFKPAILLADEPTGNLDSHASSQIWDMLAELAEKKQMTIIMVTHETAGAAHCSHAFVLRDGRIDTQIEMESHDARWLADRYQQSLE